MQAFAPCKFYLIDIPYLGFKMSNVYILILIVTYVLEIFFALFEFYLH